MKLRAVSSSSKWDVAILGGGVGGCAAALALTGRGLRVALSEPTAWIGGQLTSQAVPPDEHPWIESFGCTASYRRFREGVRQWYRENRRLTASAAADPFLNPGRGWVSRLCCEPKAALATLKSMVEPAVGSGELTIFRNLEPIAASSSGDRIEVVLLRNRVTGAEVQWEADIFLDATESGDLLQLAGVEHRVGAETRAQTGEAHAIAGPAEPGNVQGITWCFAMGFDPDGDHRIGRPEGYGRWKEFAPTFWAGPLLGWRTIHAHTGEPFEWTLFAHEHERGMGLFDYRQIVSRATVADGSEEATIVNWPQNDYFGSNPLADDPESKDACYREARELSLCLLYWLQHEAPRPDGGTGYPGLRLRPDLAGSSDGFALHPYIRESRRIEARFTVLERHVSVHDRPGATLAEPFADTVGIGSYRIDLHPSSNGRPTVDFPTLPFQIPLGALVPVRVRNLLPACKNLGVTHITNGCYRLHPVEWNIGEAAGALAGFCQTRRLEPAQVWESAANTADFQRELVRMGVELAWPEPLVPPATF